MISNGNVRINIIGESYIIKIISEFLTLAYLVYANVHYLKQFKLT